MPDPSEKSASNEYGIDVFERSDVTVLQHQQMQAHISSTQSEAVFFLDEMAFGEGSNLTNYLFVIVTLSVLTLLQRHGFFAIHGAALATQDGSAVIIVGPSDSGKSTLSLNIAKAGWDYLSDDSILLYDNGDSVEVRPFRRHFGVDPDAAELFPEIEQVASQMLTDPDKWRLDVESIFSGKLVESASPEVIVFPHVANSEKTTTDRISQVDAITQLMTQGTFIEADREIASRQMSLFAKLVKQCANYRLNSGLDIKANPALVDELMLGLLARNHPA